jgi:hypothetical protein
VNSLNKKYGILLVLSPMDSLILYKDLIVRTMKRNPSDSLMQLLPKMNEESKENSIKLFMIEVDKNPFLKKTFTQFKPIYFSSKKK